MADEKMRDEELVGNDQDLTDETQFAEGKEAKDEAENTSDSESQLDEEIENLKNSLLRLQADFTNYKNRSIKEKSDTIKNATSSLVQDILPVLDNFSRAFIAAEQAGLNPELIEGFKLIQKDLENLLIARGLEEIESDGEIFDPNLHEAVATEPSNEESGIIIETFQKGYKLNDKVIRASIVKVSE